MSIKEHKTYRDNGELHRHFFYKGDTLNLHGEYKSYYGNGELQSHCLYKDGKLNGEYKCWYGNAQHHRYYYMDIKIGPDDIANYPHPTPEELVMIELKYGSEAC